MYCIGMLSSGNLIVWEKSHSAILAPLSLAVIVTSRIFLWGSWCYLLVLLPMGFTFLFAISNLISHFRIIQWLAEKISYASMNMYLFHRLWFFLVIVAFYDHHPHSAAEPVIPLYMALFIYSPLLLVACYYLQKLYNTYVLKYLHWLRYMKYSRMVRQRLRDIREAARRRVG